MDWLTFSATIIKALVWPVALLTVLLLFRQAFAASLPALAARLQSAKWPGGELAFGEKVADMAEKIAASPVSDLAAQINAGDPADLIEKNWNDFQKWLQPRMKAHGISISHEENYGLFIDRILKGANKVKSADTNVSYQDFRDLVNDAMLYPWRLTMADAERFERLINLVKSRIPT